MWAISWCACQSSYNYTDKVHCKTITYVSSFLWSPTLSCISPFLPLLSVPLPPPSISSPSSLYLLSKCVCLCRLRRKLIQDYKRWRLRCFPTGGILGCLSLNQIIYQLHWFHSPTRRMWGFVFIQCTKLFRDKIALLSLLLCIVAQNNSSCHYISWLG